MRMPFSDADSDGPNLTPMIDVVFLLLIFFLVATRFKEESEQDKDLAVNLPDVTDAEVRPKPLTHLIVNVLEDGQYKVKQDVYTEEALSDLLGQQARVHAGRLRVQLRVDRRTPFQYPVRVISFCKRDKIPHTCAVVTGQ